jgi:hypothetical protein
MVMVERILNRSAGVAKAASIAVFTLLLGLAAVRAVCFQMAVAQRTKNYLYATG